MGDLTPNEARQRLGKIMRTGYFDEEERILSPFAPTIRAVMIAAERGGLSDEDKYALIACQLAIAAQRYFEIAMDLAQRGPPIIVVKAETATSQWMKR
jgi:hypothetical protein